MIVGENEETDSNKGCKVLHLSGGVKVCVCSHVWLPVCMYCMYVPVFPFFPHFGFHHNLIPPPICSQRRVGEKKGGEVGTCRVGYHYSSLLLLFLFICSLSLSSTSLCLSPSLSSSTSSPLIPPPPLPPARLSSFPPFIFRYKQNGAQLPLKTQQVCGVSNCT